MLRHLLVLVVLLAASQLPLYAEQVAFRYMPTAANGSTSLYRGSDGAPGERRAWWGGPARAFNQEVRATHIVTFKHPYNNQNVSVPLTLPDGTPRIDYATDRVIYNYGAYMVTSRFLPDGSVEVIYNSGLFRPLQFR